MNRFLSTVLVGLLPLAAMACAPSEKSDAQTTAAAVSSNNENNDHLLAEVFMRQVLSQQLLHGNGEIDALNYEILKVALEGPGDGNMVASISTLTCDRGLGSDYCDVMIGTDSVKPSEDETEAGYKLHVRVYQGKVINASMELFAG